MLGAAERGGWRDAPAGEQTAKNKQQPVESLFPILIQRPAEPYPRLSASLARMARKSTYAEDRP